MILTIGEGGASSMISGWMNGWIGEWMGGSTKWVLTKTITKT